MSQFEIVDTELGKVRGIRKVSALDTPFSAFLGIPYATAPIGELRFKVSDLYSVDGDTFLRYQAYVQIRTLMSL